MHTLPSMTVGDKQASLLNRIAKIAASLQSKLTWFLRLGGLATLILVWEVYSHDAPIWWNVMKCGFVSLPALVWGFVWLVLNQLREAPALVSELAADDDGVFANLDELSLRQANGLRGLFNTLAAFRREDGFEVVFETISGVSLIANPLFAIVAIVAMGVLALLIFIAPLLLLF